MKEEVITKIENDSDAEYYAIADDGTISEVVVGDVADGDSSDETVQVLYLDTDTDSLRTHDGKGVVLEEKADTMMVMVEDSELLNEQADMLRPVLKSEEEANT